MRREIPILHHLKSRGSVQSGFVGYVLGQFEHVFSNQEKTGNKSECRFGSVYGVLLVKTPMLVSFKHSGGRMCGSFYVYRLAVS